MIPNQISYELNQTTIDQIIHHLDAIRTLMPFLVGLSPQERKRLNPAGDASQAFIRKSASVAQLIPAYLPRGLDVTEMQKDIALMDAMQLIRVTTESLAEQMADTQAVVSSEAYAAALHVYRSAKMAQGPHGIEDAVRELSRRFARSSPSVAADTEPEALPETSPEPLPAPTPQP